MSMRYGTLSRAKFAVQERGFIEQLERSIECLAGCLMSSICASDKIMILTTITFAPMSRLGLSAMSISFSDCVTHAFYRFPVKFRLSWRTEVGKST